METSGSWLSAAGGCSSSGNNGGVAISTSRHGGRRGNRWLSVALAGEPSASADRRDAVEAKEAGWYLLPVREHSTAAAHRADRTVASDGDWLVLGAEVSRNLTQVVVASTGMGHGSGPATSTAGRQDEFITRWPKGLHSAGTTNRLALLWSKAAALSTGTGRNPGFVEAECVVRKLYTIARADIFLVRRRAPAPGVFAAPSWLRKRRTSAAARLAVSRPTSIRIPSFNPSSGGQ